MSSLMTCFLLMLLYSGVPTTIATTTTPMTSIPTPITATTTPMASMTTTPTTTTSMASMTTTTTTTTLMTSITTTTPTTTTLMTSMTTPTTTTTTLMADITTTIPTTTTPMTSITTTTTTTTSMASMTTTTSTTTLMAVITTTATTITTPVTRMTTTTPTTTTPMTSITTTTTITSTSMASVTTATTTTTTLMADITTTAGTTTTTPTETTTVATTDTSATLETPGIILTQPTSGAPGTTTRNTTIEDPGPSTEDNQGYTPSMVGTATTGKSKSDLTTTETASSTQGKSLQDVPRESTSVRFGDQSTSGTTATGQLSVLSSGAPDFIGETSSATLETPTSDDNVSNGIALSASQSPDKEGTQLILATTSTSALTSSTTVDTNSMSRCDCCAVWKEFLNRNVSLGSFSLDDLVVYQKKKLQTVDDKRLSARSIGGSAVAMLVISFLTIVVLDASKLFQDFRKMYKHLRESFRPQNGKGIQDNRVHDA